jgi:glycerophosphoryl diester phosphodiesterase
VLTAHPDVRLFLELKEAAAREFGEETVVKRVVREVEPVLDRCVMISFSEKLLLEAQRHAGCAVGPVVRKWKDRGIIDRFERRPGFLFCDIRGLPREGELAVEGVELAVYEVPDAPTAMALHERGVAYVETFGVCEMLSDLRALR